MTAKELAELKAELLAELRAEQERKDRNRTTFKRVMEPFESSLNHFDWTDTFSGVRPDGSTFGWSNEITYGPSLRSSLGALLRAVFRAKSVAALPRGKEGEMQHFVDHVLKLMEEYHVDSEAQYEQAG